MMHAFADDIVLVRELREETNRKVEMWSIFENTDFV